MTGKEKILAVLKRGGRWTTPALANAAKIAHNTTIKWICMLRKEGIKIRGDQAPGKSYYEFWIDKHASEAEILYDNCITIRDTYPPDCRERIKIQIQINEMESRHQFQKAA